VWSGSGFNLWRKNHERGTRHSIPQEGMAVLQPTTIDGCPSKRNSNLDRHTLQGTLRNDNISPNPANLSFFHHSHRPFTPPSYAAAAIVRATDKHRFTTHPSTHPPPSKTNTHVQKIHKNVTNYIQKTKLVTPNRESTSQNESISHPGKYAPPVTIAQRGAFSQHHPYYIYGC